MKTHGNLLIQNFASLFNFWFNSDLIDVSDHAEAISLAGTVMADLMQKGTPAQEITGPLTEALAHWGRQSWTSSATPAIATGPSMRIRRTC